MSVKVKLSLAFQERVGSGDRIEMEGHTVKECLENFVARFPPARAWIFDGKGCLLSLVLLNGETLSPDQLNLPIADDDELWILNLLEGG